MNLLALWESDKKGELILVDGGVCRFHIRKDRQLTIYEIYVQEVRRGEGIGRGMLEMLKEEPCSSIFARCPEEYESNEWYEAMGFDMEGTSTTRSGTRLNHWRLVL